MTINAISATKMVNVIPHNNSIRKIFYTGTTTLDDMTHDRVQATIFDAVRYLAKPYKKAALFMRILLGVKTPKEIESNMIPIIKTTILQMPQKAFGKLQKALVILEDINRKDQKIYRDSFEYYNDIVENIFNRVVYKQV